MQGQQCLRLLWLSTNKLLPEKTIAEKQKLEQGHDFEEYAHKLFPDAINLVDLEFEENLEKTKELIEQKKTIFEAGLKIGDLFLRADVLEPTEKGWNLYEIKASTKQKPEHIPNSLAPALLIESIGKDLPLFSELAEKYVFTGVYDLQEKFLRKDLNKWGYDYEQG